MADSGGDGGNGGLWNFVPWSSFYSDYLAGSTYFNAAYPEQNLFRARVQFALVRSIERQFDRPLA